MNELAVRVENLGKQYKRGLHVEPYRTARDAVASLVHRGGSGPSRDASWFWALRDLSFEVERGETVGLIGRNGAGKTTLLKILSRITPPTLGHAEYYGRLGSLLEVGTGFHLELTGRENVKLNGAVLGLSRREIDSRFDEIVEFAGVEAFVDTPVKRYSSGMFMRLAFSVAAHLEPDILVVDEVLAVGDIAFQRKCLGKIDQVSREGRTVFFVSHNMASVAQICARGILLDQGRIVEDGPIGSVIDAYLQRVGVAEAEVKFDLTDDAKGASFARLSTLREDGTPSARFGTDESIVCEIEFEVHEPLEFDHVWLRLYQATGLLLNFATDQERGVGVPEVRQPGRYRARYTIPPFLLNEGTYRYRVQMLHPSPGVRNFTTLDDRRSAVFEVEDTIDYGDAILGPRKGVFRVPFDYEEQRIGDLVAGR